MNRLLVQCFTFGFSVVSSLIVFAADPPKALFDWRTQTTPADVTRELSGNLRDNVLDLGIGKITLTPSLKVVKADVGTGTLLLTIKVEEPDQTVKFENLVGMLGYYMPMEARPRNFTVEKSPHSEKFIRKGQVTLTLRDPNAKTPPPYSLQRPEKPDPKDFKPFPGQAGSEDKTPAKILDEEKEAVAYIKKIGGLVSCDEQGAGGHVVEIHFYAANLPKVKGGWRISKEDLRMIASLKHLRLLDLIHVTIPNDLLIELAPAKSLTTLHLQAISDETLVALNKANLLHALPIAKAKDDKRPAKTEDVDAIDLSGSGKQISNKGLKELTACKNVTTLTIGGIGLTKIAMPEGLKQINEFKELKTLNFVGQVFLTDPLIKQYGSLKNLTELRINANDRDIAKLRKMLPNCDIQRP